MSVKILTESEFSCERTLVYRTVYKNLVVLIQQRKQVNVWNTYHHCLLPNLLINANAAALPNFLINAIAALPNLLINAIAAQTRRNAALLPQEVSYLQK